MILFWSVVGSCLAFGLACAAVGEWKTAALCFFASTLFTVGIIWRLAHDR